MVRKMPALVGMCLVCYEPRLVDPLADAIAHAQCDQKIAALDPDMPDLPGFWESAGTAAG